MTEIELKTNFPPEIAENHRRQLGYKEMKIVFDANNSGNILLDCAETGYNETMLEKGIIDLIKIRYNNYLEEEKKEQKKKFEENMQLARQSHQEKILDGYIHKDNNKVSSNYNKNYNKPEEKSIELFDILALIAWVGVWLLWWWLR